MINMKNEGSWEAWSWQSKYEKKKNKEEMKSDLQILVTEFVICFFVVISLYLN